MASSNQPSPTFMIEQYGAGSPSPLPPPPPRQSRQPSERLGSRPEQERPQDRSPRAARLPTLRTTNLPLPLLQPPPGSAPLVVPTPLSTISLSSPFTTAHPLPHPFSPTSTALSREQSPMATRMASYNVPYNPSEWASGSRQPSTTADNEQHDPEAGIAAPPPPYSPPQQSPAEIAVATAATPPQPTHTGAVPAISRGLPPPPPRHAIQDGAHHPNRSSLVPPKQRRPLSVASLSAAFAVESNQLHPEAAQVGAGFPAAPSAKRAASTGATPPRSLSRSVLSVEGSHSRSTSSSRGWQVGMPLPGPPPGPPPSASRSSSTHAPQEPARGVSPAAPVQHAIRRVALHAPQLSPMPPTPAGWTEDQPMRPGVAISSRQVQKSPLHILTSNLGPSIPSQDFFPATEPVGESARLASTFVPGSMSGRPMSGSGLLARSSAFRDRSAKGLRERRNIRNSLHAADGGADLSALSVKTNPWGEPTDSAASNSHSPAVFSADDQPTDRQEYSSSTSPAFGRPPRSAPSSQTQASLPGSVALDQTPASSASTPRSPVVSKMKSPAAIAQILSLTHPPKTLPTPPLSQKAPESSRSLEPSSASAPGDFENDSIDKFVEESLQRHHAFLQKESEASSDGERFQTFVDYIAVESVLRQQRYAAAFVDDHLNLDATRKRIFNYTDSAVQAFFEQSAAVDTPAASVSSALDDNRHRPESTWWPQYQPALSPIASMSYDEMSSRGRSSSRWWESQAGSQTDGPANKVRRSKRESKYMGLSTALMQTSIDESDTPKNKRFDAPAQASEYPDEKADPSSFGVYDEDAEPAPHSQDFIPHPSPNMLDVSRFITLPPPYPRHYPAVNNAHPVLANYRVCVRAMSELSEIQERKSRYELSVQALRNQHNEKQAGARTAFKNNVKVQIEDGTITYAEAAEAEEALRVDERRAEQATLKAEFDTLQDVVIGPLHDMLNGRLTQLSARMNELTEKLFVDAQEQDPDQPQQEGDDTPELLEYLTQLKWMFETREQIHKEIFDLLTERNDKYKAIVSLPYQQANNLDKVRDTESFFVRDNLDRAKTYYQESVNRHEQFFNIIEDNVARGVDLQSSAFWDLAPGLLELLQQIPSDVAHLHNIVIPEQEYLENPSYFRYPQQYLYTLLDHAEKSTYQFIESQINLHCLLHEVKTSVLLARCRMMEANERVQTETTPAPKISDYRIKEEAVLTTELKQKVSIIEEQWMDAIGTQLRHAREQVKTYLESQGAWDDVTRDD